MQISKRIRQHCTAEESKEILDLHWLRSRGRRKFSRAHQMFFFKKQLEQASNEAIAYFKAKRFQRFQSIADLCCGIGGDSIGLSQESDLTIVDLDRDVLAFAEKNVSAYQGKFSSVVGNAADISVHSFDAFHIDPDRRESQARVTKPEYFAPSKHVLENLTGNNPNFAMKLAPATPIWSRQTENEFIGYDGECKQQIVWSGDLCNTPGVRATVVRNNSLMTDTYHAGWDQIDANLIRVKPQGRFLYDPHACLVAAKLVDSFSRQYKLARVSPSTVYLSGDELVHNTLVQGFEILAITKMEKASIKKMLQSQQVTDLEFKKRGIPVKVFNQMVKTNWWKGQKKGPPTAESCLESSTGRHTMIFLPTTNGYKAFLCKRIANQANIASD